MRAPPIGNQPRTPNIIIHLHRRGCARVAQLSGGLAVRLAHVMIVSTTVGRTRQQVAAKARSKEESILVFLVLSIVVVFVVIVFVAVVVVVVIVIVVTLTRSNGR